ncbi:MAG: ATP-binding cassette domain-containing protein, partial [Thermocrispum sp.]
HHAEFRATPEGRFEIRDLGSHNGTYVNGQPLPKSGSAVITPQDTVGVGHSTFRLVDGRLEEFVDTGEVSFSARHLTVKVDNGKVILNNVTFGVPEKSLVAVIGPSGSGKSTLLKALTGYRPANIGDVLYDNRNLYKQFAELRQRIGLVPQDDILHKELTVRTALRYAARLRFPGDVAEAERNHRIEEVLAELKLDIHATKKITSLSGGQRKRVSVALELLTKPSLIFLDEPTSGLDPGMDRDVMQLLRGLADDGRTVLVVTHSVAELALCDKLLVMAPGGGVSYFGPPEEALNFFGYDSWADVFSAFENYRDYDWMGRWQGSQHYQLYAADIDAVAPQPQQQGWPQQMMPAARLVKPQSWGSQLWTLTSRYLSVIASDKGFMALMLLLPAILGVVSTLIPSDHGFLKHELWPKAFNQDAGTILLILAVGMCFSGAANSVRELIKERVIYERERAPGLSRSAYLMSKVIVLTLITAFQGVIICVIGFSVRDMPEEGLIMPPAMEMCLAIIALGFTSMAFGLVIS